MSELEISQEFIEENKSNLGQFMPKPRRRGPYSKQEKEKRRLEVYRLHFDYGYSARKISDLMKVNRNTINGDISYWYSKIASAQNIFDPEMNIAVFVKRFEEQRIRLREQVDKTTDFAEKMILEKMIFELDSKILQTYQKLAASSKRIMDLASSDLNKYMKDSGKKDRFYTLYEKLSVSEKAREKIEKIIKEDNKPKIQP